MKRKKTKKSPLKQKYLYFFGIISAIVAIATVISIKHKDGSSTGYAQTVSYPKLDRLETVTTNDKGDGNTYVPDAWGYHKSRVVRLSTGDIYTTYLDSGNKWHLMHRPPNGGWTDIKSGDAGSEPVNIVRGPQDDVHVFAWPGRQGILNDIYTTDNGATFATKTVSGFEVDTQGYAGAGADSKGDFVVLNTENDTPYEFWWSYYTASTKQWSSVHTYNPQYGYSYAFVFPGENNNVTFSAMRDVHWSTLGYTPSGDFDYVLNEIRNFDIADVTNPQVTSFQVKEEIPHAGSPNEMTYEEDAYIDTKGIMHILYKDGNTNGMRESLVQNGKVLKDVALNLPNIYKNRMTQDSTGKFYILTVDSSSFNVTPAADGDTDGTQFGTPTKFDLGNRAGCDDFDFCLAPTFTTPRSGNAAGDVVDGIYSNMHNMYYFRILLRDPALSTSTTPIPDVTSQPTSSTSITPGGTATTISLNLCPHEIGDCGDNVNQGTGGNTSPKHTSRQVTLSFLNANNQPVGTAQGTVTYSTTSQTFQGTAVANLASGQYLVSVKMDGFLGQKISGIVTIVAGTPITLPMTYLVAGDINNDNQLDILDYNNLISCYGSKQTSATCLHGPTATSQGADINDDGSVNGVDYNLFLRELSVQKGG